MMNPRKFQLYCIGMPRSGTHSMAYIFAKAHRARHEPEFPDLITNITTMCHEEGKNGSLTKYLQTRDKRLWLECEASFLLIFFVDILAEAFPKAKFILTMRDCYTWLNSMINQQVAMDRSQTELTRWFGILDFMFTQDFQRGITHTEFEREESILVENGLYPIRNYLLCWARHNEELVKRIPGDRLLILRTHEIADKFHEIADFLGIHPESLDMSRSHSDERKEKKLEIFSVFGRDFLEERVSTYCGDLMSRFFPEVRSVEDLQAFRSG